MSSVLLISPETWDTHKVSKHHYARVLAATGRKVFFVEPPARTTNQMRVTQTQDIEGVFVVSGPRVAPGLQYLPGVPRRRLERSWLASLESMAATTIETIWLFENSRFFDMNFGGDRLKIYHQVDLDQDFHSEIAAKTADIFLCTTDIIRSRLKRVRQDVHKIHHGTAMLDVLPERDPRLDTDSIQAAYIGNLDQRYLDIEGIRRIITSHHQVQFHMIGGYNLSVGLHALLQQASNVVWWGRIPPERVAGILSRMDIHLVAYDTKNYYFQTGKVVVCSYTDEYKDKRYLVEMADPEQDVADVFDRVVGDLDFYNSSERQTERIHFAKEHSYEKLLAHIERLVAENTGSTV